MQHTLRHGLLAATVLLALAACGQQGSTSPAASAASGTASASAPAGLNSDNEKASYLMGYEVGASVHEMKKNGLEIDQDAFLKGLNAAAASEPLPFSDEEAVAVMQKFQADQMAKMEARQQETAKTNQEKGQAFLTENKAKEGVKTTASGLQYKVLTAGTGKSPKATDVVEVNYEGKLLDGTVFDSSYERGEPIEFPLNQVIAGWTEGLQLMKEGGKYEFYIPSDIAYGEAGNAGIEPNSTLIFTVELLKVK